jgi:predicted RNA polymerase sigma factor
MAALNRTYALSKVNGKEEAIREAEKLKLEDNHFYFALLGELYTGIDNEKAEVQLRRAMELSKVEGERQALQKKIMQLWYVPATF